MREYHMPYEIWKMLLRQYNTVDNIMDGILKEEFGMICRLPDSLFYSIVDEKKHAAFLLRFG